MRKEISRGFVNFFSRPPWARSGPAHEQGIPSHLPRRPLRRSLCGRRRPDDWPLILSSAPSRYSARLRSSNRTIDRLPKMRRRPRNHPRLSAEHLAETGPGRLSRHTPNARPTRRSELDGGSPRHRHGNGRPSRRIAIGASAVQAIPSDRCLAPGFSARPRRGQNPRQDPPRPRFARLDGTRSKPEHGSPPRSRRIRPTEATPKMQRWRPKQPTARDPGRDRGPPARRIPIARIASPIPRMALPIVPRAGRSPETPSILHDLPPRSTSDRIAHMETPDLTAMVFPESRVDKTPVSPGASAI